MLINRIVKAKVNIFLSLSWIYDSVWFPLTMESNLATFDLSDFSHSLLMCWIKFLEIISVLEFLWVCVGHAVCVCSWHLIFFSVFPLFRLSTAFFLPVLCHVPLSCECTNYQPNENMHGQYS